MSFNDSFIKFDSKGRAYAIVDDDDSDSDDDFDFQEIPAAKKQQLVEDGRELFNLDSFFFKRHTHQDPRSQYWSDESNTDDINDISFRNSGIDSLFEAFEPRKPTDVPKSKPTNQQASQVAAPTVPTVQVVPTTTQAQPSSQQNQTLTNQSSVQNVTQQSVSPTMDYNKLYNDFLLRYAKVARKSGVQQFNTKDREGLKQTLISKSQREFDIDSKIDIFIGSTNSDDFMNRRFHPSRIKEIKNFINSCNDRRKTYDRFSTINYMKFVYVGGDGFNHIKYYNTKVMITLDIMKNKYPKEYGYIVDICNDSNLYPWADSIFSQLIIAGKFFNDKRFFLLPHAAYVPKAFRFKFNEVAFLPYYLPTINRDTYLTDYASLLLTEKFPRFILNFDSLYFFMNYHFRRLKFQCIKINHDTKLTAKSDIFGFYHFG